MVLIEMVFYGAGGHAKAVIESWLESGNSITKIFDDDSSVTRLLTWPVSRFQPSSYKETPLVISIGNNKLRMKIADRLEGYVFGKVVHPAAIISTSIELGNGSVVLAGAIINASTLVGAHCILNTGAIVEHDCKLDDFVHIAPNATLCGGVEIGEGSLVGAGAVVIPGVRIGKWSIVGAGAVVLKNLPDYSTAIGNPAKLIKSK